MSVKFSQLFAALLLVGAFCSLTVPAYGTSTSYQGCFSCHYLHSVGIDSICRSEVEGEGWICTEVTFLDGGVECYTNGQACAWGATGSGGGGGGGGTTGGGGGGGCNVANGAVCPAACSGCRRPAI